MPCEVVQDVVGAWEVMQPGYYGYWAAFADERVARNFAVWLEENFDTDGLIERLYNTGNTPEDREAIRIIVQRSKHVSEVPSIHKETLDDVFNRGRK